MLDNIRTYIARFFGDLGTLLIGGVALIPLAYGYIGDLRWLTAPSVKWGTLAIGFVLASYRIWRRAEVARTTDSVAVLVADAEQIEFHIRSVTEFFGWPLTFSNGERVMQPFVHRVLAQDASPGLFVLEQVRVRIEDHRDLVVRILTEHGVNNTGIMVSPDQLFAETVLFTWRDYIERLRTIARPPPSLFQDWTTQRYQR